MLSFKILCTLSVLAHFIFAHPSAEGGSTAARNRCGYVPTAEDRARASTFAKFEANFDDSTPLNILNRAATRASVNITVQTYIHVVARSNSLAGGYVPRSQLTAQIAVLNKAFNPFGISHVLAGITYTVNANWASFQNELTMKKALRKGDYKTLNIYYLFDVGGVLGWCYLPDEKVSPGSKTFISNKGKTTNHEVGHWWGLLHTFDGDSCTGSGDEVADTPAQKSASDDCPVGRDSCPKQPGLDPIHNFMDYSDDSCTNQFTPGQGVRMINMYNSLRAKT